MAEEKLNPAIQLVEPSDEEQEDWSKATTDYVYALEIQNERLSSALEYLREERPISDSFVWQHVDEILEGK